MYQKRRILRAIYEPIQCERFVPLFDGGYFSIIGKDSLYLVEVDINNGITCDCLDFQNRGEFMICKHVCWLLLRAGLSIEQVIDLDGELSIDEVKLLLNNPQHLVSTKG